MFFRCVSACDCSGITGTGGRSTSPVVVGGEECRLPHDGMQIAPWSEWRKAMKGSVRRLVNSGVVQHIDDCRN